MPAHSCRRTCSFSEDPISWALAATNFYRSEPTVAIGPSRGQPRSQTNSSMPVSMSISRDPMPLHFRPLSARLVASNEVDSAIGPPESKRDCWLGIPQDILIILPAFFGARETHHCHFGTTRNLWLRSGTLRALALLGPPKVADDPSHKQRTHTTSPSQVEVSTLA